MKQFLVGVLVLCASALATASPKPVEYVNLAKYIGAWYQIARNPVPFEDGCVCSRQVLTPNADGRIEVYNSCNDKTADGPLREIRGYATNDDTTSNAMFTVDFNLPKKGAYWIIGLDDDYRYAVVTDPAMISLYILSKTPTLDTELYQEALQKATDQVDTSKLTLTAQENCVYP